MAWPRIEAAIDYTQGTLHWSGSRTKDVFYSLSFELRGVRIVYDGGTGF